MKATKELIEFVKKQVTKGVDQKKIIDALRQEGWEDDAINEAFSKSEKGVSKGPILILVVLLLILLGGGGYYWYSNYYEKDSGKIEEPKVFKGFNQPTAKPSEVINEEESEIPLDGVVEEKPKMPNVPGEEAVEEPVEGDDPAEPNDLGTADLQTQEEGETITTKPPAGALTVIPAETPEEPVEPEVDETEEDVVPN